MADRNTREQRSSGRVPHRLAVTIEAGDQSIAAISRNVSVGGMFLETTTPLAERARIRLRFSVPARAEPIVTEAEVRWREATGVGVQFLGLRAADVWALGKLLAMPPGSAS